MKNSDVAMQIGIGVAASVLGAIAVNAWQNRQERQANRMWEI